MIEIQGKGFEIGRLNARQQFHIARRIAPVIVSLVDDGVFNGEKAAEALAELKDEDADYIFNT